MTDSLHLEFMREALKEAETARDEGEVPVGAVIVAGGKIISRAHNTVEKETDATMHAEISAIRRASETLKNWRLEETSLYVTLEPCSMCIGALILSRVRNLYFGAWDLRQGAVGSLFDLSAHPGLPHKVNVFPEVCAAESERMLKQFFESRRK